MLGKNPEMKRFSVAIFAPKNPQNSIAAKKQPSPYTVRFFAGSLLLFAIALAKRQNKSDNIIVEAQTMAVRAVSESFFKEYRGMSFLRFFVYVYAEKGKRCIQTYASGKEKRI